MSSTPIEYAGIKLDGSPSSTARLAKRLGARERELRRLSGDRPSDVGGAMPARAEPPDSPDGTGSSSPSR